MTKYNYDALKETAKTVKAELAEKGMFAKKTSRRKPRSREKTALIYKRALNRLEKYKPRKKDGKIILSYFGDICDK